MKSCDVGRARRAWTIVELLAVIGTLMVLTGFFLTAAAGTRSRARAVSCLAEMGAHARVLTAYAGDYADYWPVATDKVGPSVLLPGVAPGSTPDVPYPVLAGVWHLAVLDAYNESPFHESLICAMDHRTLAQREAIARTLGVGPDRIRSTIDRQLSGALLLDPAALDPAAPSNAVNLLRPQTHAAVSFPAAKAALIEVSPWHDRRYDGDVATFTKGTHSVSAADGSAALRSKTSAVAGVPWPPPPLPATDELVTRIRADAATFLYTPYGVRGRDW